MDLILGVAVLVAIIIFLIALGIIFKILKAAFGIALFVIGVILLLSSVSIYRDVNNFKTQFNVSGNVFLLADQNILLAGFIQGNDTYSFFDEESLAKYQRYNDRAMEKEMLADNYKLWKIDIVSLENEKDFDVILAEKDVQKRSVSFSYMVADKVDSDIMFFFREYQKNNIIVYKKTALFMFIDFIPLDYLKKNFEQIKMSLKQKIESFIKNKTEGLV